MINPVVVDLLRIRTLHLRQFFINPFFSSPGHQNYMADDASRLFDISDISLLVHMSATYLRPQISWQISLPLSYLISCVISAMRRKP